MNTENLPKKIAIFPLSNAVVFPKTVLPLNIFEDRYIQLIRKRGKALKERSPQNSCDKTFTIIFYHMASPYSK